MCSPEQIRHASLEEELASDNVPEELRTLEQNLEDPDLRYLDLTNAESPDLPAGAPEPPPQAGADQGTSQETVAPDLYRETDPNPLPYDNDVPMTDAPAIPIPGLAEPDPQLEAPTRMNVDPPAGTPPLPPEVIANNRLDGIYKPIRSGKSESSRGTGSSLRHYQPYETLVAAAASDKEPDSSTDLIKRGLHDERGHDHEVLLCGDKDDSYSFDDEVIQKFLDDWAPVFPVTGGERNLEMIYLSAGQIKKRKEVNFNRLSAAQRAQFEQAMRTEWANIQKPHATRVLDLKETRKIRSCPSLSKRIIRTRWVLTEKEHETGEATTAKARLVIQGHNDPDVGEVECASPTLSREALPILLLGIAGCKWTMHIADIKGAFMNSRALNRPNGPLYAQLPHIWPVDGVDPQQLVEVKVAWYGLNDGPIEFYRTLDEHLLSLGLQKSKLDPCLYRYFNRDGKLAGLAGVTVDDICYGGDPEFHEIMAKVNERFPFGKLRIGNGRFCGRDLNQEPDKSITVDQAFYAERLEPAVLEKDRRQDKGSKLRPAEITILREKCGALNWLQGITRPDLSGGSSLLQTSFGEPTVADLLEANRLLKEAKEFANTKLKILSLPVDSIRFGATADSAWANNRDLSSQMGYLVFATDPSMDDGQWAPFVPLVWKSHKQKRKVPSTLAAESMAAGEALGSLDWVRAIFEELVDPTFDLRNWETAVSHRPSILLTDCKSVYDSLRQPWTSASKCDKRTSIDLAIIRDTLSRDLSKIRWIDTRMQLVDSFTKTSATPELLRRVMQSGRYIIVEETQALKIKQSRRKPGTARDTSSAPTAPTG